VWSASWNRFYAIGEARATNGLKAMCYSLFTRRPCACGGATPGSGLSRLAADQEVAAGPEVARSGPLPCGDVCECVFRPRLARAARASGPDVLKFSESLLPRFVLCDRDTPSTAARSLRAVVTLGTWSADLWVEVDGLAWLERFDWPAGQVMVFGGAHEARRAPGRLGALPHGLAKTITCPAGQVEPFEPGETVHFDPEVCGPCPKRDNCTQARAAVDGVSRSQRTKRGRRLSENFKTSVRTRALARASRGRTRTRTHRRTEGAPSALPRDPPQTSLICGEPRQSRTWSRSTACTRTPRK